MPRTPLTPEQIGSLPEGTEIRCEWGRLSNLTGFLHRCSNRAYLYHNEGRHGMGSQPDNFMPTHGIMPYSWGITNDHYETEGGYRGYTCYLTNPPAPEILAGINGGGGNALCDDCGDDIRAREVFVKRRSGTIYCESCFHDRFIYCKSCEKWHKADNIQTFRAFGRAAERVMCDNCFRVKYYTCLHCGDIHRMGNGTSVLGGVICSTCRDADYFNCPDCGALTANGEGVHHAGRDETYCSRCYGRIRPGRINGYDYRPKPKFFRTKREKRQKECFYMGVELEADRSEYQEEFCEYMGEKHDNHIYLKEDGTISCSSGVEIVTHPCTLDYHKNQLGWADICSEAVRRGFQSHNTSNCGLHIHIGRDGLSNLDTLKMSYFIKEHKEEFEKLARRSDSEWATFKDKHVKVKDCANPDQRYEALNFCNEKTIEFRMFRGTLKIETLLATIELVHSLAFWSKAVNIKTVLNHSKSWENFTEFISKDKEYKGLRAYMIERGVINGEFVLASDETNC